MKSVMLLLVVFLFTLPTVAQDTQPQYVCRSSDLTTPLNNILTLVTTAEGQNVQNILKLLADIRNQIAATTADCYGYVFSGSASQEVLGPVFFSEGLYIMTLDTDDGSVELTALQDALCFAFLANREEGETVQRVFEAGEDCRVLFEVDIDADYVLTFEPID